MNNTKGPFTEILRDLRARRYLDVYIPAFACLVLTLLSLCGVTNTKVLFATILGMLVVFAYQLVEQRRCSENAKDALNRMKEAIASCTTNKNAEFFREWNNVDFEEKLIDSNRVSILAVSPNEFLTRNSGSLRSFLNRGNHLRCLLVDPEDQSTVALASGRMFGAEQAPEILKKQVESCLTRLKEILSESNGKGVLEVRVTKFPPSNIMTFVETDSGEATMFVTNLGFDQPFESRPSFSLQKHKDGKWFDFYFKCFEKMWISDQTHDVQMDVIPYHKQLG